MTNLANDDALIDMNASCLMSFVCSLSSDVWLTTYPRRYSSATLLIFRVQTRPELRHKWGVRQFRPHTQSNATSRHCVSCISWSESGIRAAHPNRESLLHASFYSILLHGPAGGQSPLKPIWCVSQQERLQSVLLLLLLLFCFAGSFLNLSK